VLGDLHARPRRSASDGQALVTGQVIERGDRRIRAGRARVEEDVPAAVLLVDLVVAGAVSGIIAEETSAGVPGAVVAVEVRAEQGGRLLASTSVRADIETTAPAGHRVPPELVRRQGEVV